MIKNFIELNKIKTLFLFKFSILLFSIIYFFFLLALFLGDKEIPTTNQIIIIWTLFGLGLPLCVFLMAFFVWISNTKKRIKLFSNSPFNELESIGFECYLKNQSNKWFFTEEIKAGVISDYFLEVDIVNKSTKKIAFSVLFEYQIFDTTEKMNMSKRLSNKDVFIDFMKISKHYTSDKLKNISIGQLKSELEEFIKILKLEKIIPLEG